MTVLVEPLDTTNNLLRIHQKSDERLVLLNTMATQHLTNANLVTNIVKLVQDQMRASA